MPLTLVDTVQVLISSNLAEDPETRFATWKSDEGCVSRDLYLGQGQSLRHQTWISGASGQGDADFKIFKP